MVEGAENITKNTEGKITQNLNEAYKAAHAPYVVKPETATEELEKFTKLYREAHGSI